MTTNINDPSGRAVIYVRVSTAAQANKDFDEELSAWAESERKGPKEVVSRARDLMARGREFTSLTAKERDVVHAYMPEDRLLGMARLLDSDKDPVTSDRFGLLMRQALGANPKEWPQKIAKSQDRAREAFLRSLEKAKKRPEWAPKSR